MGPLKCGQILLFLCNFTNQEDKPSAIPGTPILKVDEDEAAYLRRELDFSRLDAIYEKLCWAGRPLNIHPLHRQKMMQRDVLITEQADLHLVWIDHVIYVKPLPAFLLDHSFFEEKLCSESSHVPQSYYDSARGFLLSYAKLVNSEADHRIAVELGLIPNLPWERWSLFASDIIRKVPELSLTKRFWYGELRLTRLNKIYHLYYGSLRGYRFGYNHYRPFFESNFGSLLVVFIYLTVALTAMQVVLACSDVDSGMALQVTLFRFGVACLVVIVAAVGFMGAVFLSLLATNLFATFANERKQKGMRERYQARLKISPRP